ncbi:MAG: ECF transporter S component [Candidatus Izemoplasmatales bacterium]
MKTRKLILTSLFIAIGIVLPQALHLFGGPTLGQILLPMHLPVFIGAMLLGPVSGLLIALFSIGVGVLLGMPSLVIASYMVFELVVYALVSGWLYHKHHLNVTLSYIIAKVLGMITAIMMIILLSSLFQVAFPPTFGTIAMFAVGIPGIIAQAIIITITVPLLRKELNKIGKIS